MNRIEFNLRGGVAGRLRALVLDSSGNPKIDTGWFPNLITNTGLDSFGAPQAVYQSTSFVGPNRCTVGTGNTAPAFTDTALVSPVAYTTTSLGAPIDSPPNYTASYVVGPPDYAHAIGTHTFALGAVVGNIAEIGLGGLVNSSSTQLLLFSRALIVDGGGTPTTISVTSADQLIVQYELRRYLDLTDTTYSGLVISGITYSGTIRRANSQTNLGQIVTPVDALNGVNLNDVTLTPYNGSIGAVTDSPSGASSNTVSCSAATYVSGNYYNSFTFAYTTAQGNLSGGISAFLLSSLGFGNWQLSVTPAIAKDNTKTLSVVFNISWARYP